MCINSVNLFLSLQKLSLLEVCPLLFEPTHLKNLYGNLEAAT